MNGQIIVLAGPSGAGKGTIFKEISKRRNNVRKVISVTTRELREDEQDGVDYIKVSQEVFNDLQRRESFFESVVYDGEFYGTLKIPTEELKERDLFFDKDVRGAISIKEAYPEAITIYIMPKDVETLLKRRGDRGKDRQKIAVDEIELAKKLDFLVINDDIEKALKEVETIIECIRTNSMKNAWNIQFLDEFY